MNVNEQAFREYQAIEDTMKSYLETTKTSDASGMANDWFEHARIVGSVDGQAINATRDEAIESISTMGTSPDAEHRFVWIDVQGNAAAVRIDSINWAGFQFTDFFVLYKVDGQWKVSSKVFDAYDRN